MMEMPEGWKRLKEDDVNHPEAAFLMKEMAEALELCIKYESEGLRPDSETHTPAKEVIKKFREWE